MSTTKTPARQSHRLVAFLALIGSFLGYIGYVGYRSTIPTYPPGSLPSDARGGGAGACRMTFMSPSYFHLAGFNRDQTRLGNGPWGLYLYREAGWDEDPVRRDDSGQEKIALGGTPVLFVPGNAGSFKQVRSLASTTTRLYWELPDHVRRGTEWDGQGSSSLDFFTLDFNDDFSAFHGQTLYDQAEYTADAIRYILELYAGQSRTGPDPTSLIVVAHSMGGTVARAAVLHDRYQQNSISTIVTFATPHLVPPVTVDSAVERFYSSVNAYWRRAYDLSSSSIKSPEPEFRVEVTPKDELSEVVTVSIHGGVSDEMIASETASLASLVPSDDSNGFAVSTTTIPGVQTPMDHLAILWCQQLMQVVANSLLSVVDTRLPEKVISRQRRVGVFSSRLLGQRRPKDPLFETDRHTSLEAIEQGKPSIRLGLNERLVVHQGGGGDRATYLIPVQPADPSAPPFRLITSASIGMEKQHEVEVYACTRLHGDRCFAVSSSHIEILPASLHGPVSPVLPASESEQTMKHVTLDAQELARFGHVAVVVKEKRGIWLLGAQTAETFSQVIHRGPLGLLLFGQQGRIERTKTSAFMSKVELPMLDTALLSLNFRLQRNSCDDKDSLFAPLLRHRASMTHETRFYPNVRTASLYTHSGGPYLPIAHTGGVTLDLFVDPTCPEQGDADVSYEIEIDVLKTIGNLLTRYRMAFVTVPAALIAFVIGIQIHIYNSGCPFPSFDFALGVFARRCLARLLGAILALCYAQTLLFVEDSTGDTILSSGHLSWASSGVRDALLGNKGAFWAPVLPLIVLTGFALVVVEYGALLALVKAVAWATGALASKSRFVGSLFSPEAQTTQSSSSQRSAALAFLLLFTFFFAPYQFAFLVLFLVHFLTTIRLHGSSREPSTYEPLARREDEPTSATRDVASGSDIQDRYHFSFSILFLILSILPLNALILVVWVRNLAVGSFAPFSSDHHVLSIFGFMALVEALHSGKMIPRTTHASALSRATWFSVGATVAYSLVYGIRRAYGVYTLENIFASWLALLMSGDQVTAFLEAARSPKEALNRASTRKVASIAATDPKLEE